MFVCFLLSFFHSISLSYLLSFFLSCFNCHRCFTFIFFPSLFFLNVIISSLLLFSDLFFSSCLLFFSLFSYLSFLLSSFYLSSFLSLTYFSSESSLFFSLLSFLNQLLSSLSSLFVLFLLLSLLFSSLLSSSLYSSLLLPSILIFPFSVLLSCLTLSSPSSPLSPPLISSLLFSPPSPLGFMASLSINLAVLNSLPFPSLDGGQLAFVIAETIAGKYTVFLSFYLPYVLSFSLFLFISL